ncbi:cupredoxin family copper-binding protein [Noviherbaspirillum sp. 17J57-3]|uniref:Cupredoxin family copper-binding protein n=2 Tax=Noviherbaspirillum galbum TaxID=2709383 RepID=A0A6B3SF06_9BURK|nr:cupredoxin family copper-binding protein [Noviherbaspirillum galbum]
MAALLGAGALASGESLAAPEARVHVVVIEGMQYTPATLEVRKGDTVVWQNKDPFPHTASAAGKVFESGSIDAGKSWKFIANTTGRFAYFCAFHPTMKGTLEVK